MPTRTQASRFVQLIFDAHETNKLALCDVAIREARVVRNRLFGVLRTVLEYVVFVMGGTAVLVMFARSVGILWSFNPEFVHPGFRAAVVSGFLYFYALLVYVPRVVVWGLVVPQILSWVFVAVLLYVAALLLAKASSRTLVSRVVAAVISLYCSGRVIVFFSPALLHDIGSIYFTMFFAGLLGGVYGFFLFPRVSSESPSTSPMLLRHWTAAGAWVLLFSANWAHTEYQLFKIHSINDPQLQLYFVKWTPAEGEVREEPIGKFAYTSRYLTDLEIEQLRAAHLTGILQTWGHTGHEYPPPPPETRRFVIVMSRPVQETIELPKPAFVDILYFQTDQGWKVFPPSVQTVPRTVRLTFSGPESHINVPSTCYSVDIGLGHPAEIPFTNTAFSWLPEEFQAPLPSLPDQLRSSSF